MVNDRAWYSVSNRPAVCIEWPSGTGKSIIAAYIAEVFKMQHVGEYFDFIGKPPLGIDAGNETELLRGRRRLYETIQKREKYVYSLPVQSPLIVERDLLTFIYTEYAIAKSGRYSNIPMLASYVKKIIEAGKSMPMHHYIYLKSAPSISATRTITRSPDGKWIGFFSEEENLKAMADVLEYFFVNYWTQFPIIENNGWLDDIKEKTKTSINIILEWLMSTTPSTAVLKFASDIVNGLDLFKEIR